MKKNQNKQKKKQSKSNEQEKINLSNEIIIGLTPKKEENKNINNSSCWFRTLWHTARRSP